MNRKEHLTSVGLLKIINLKASINKGLSLLLVESFPSAQLVSRPIIETIKIPDPYWIAGFSTGEEWFNAIVYKHNLSKLGFLVQLRFRISQHKNDKAILDLIVNYFKCGFLYKQASSDLSNNVVEFYVSGYKDIINIIIPFFDKYPILGSKSLDFTDLKKITKIINEKGHLTKQGLDQIRQIKAGMNTGRK